MMQMHILMTTVVHSPKVHKNKRFSHFVAHEESHKWFIAYGAYSMARSRRTERTLNKFYEQGQDAQSAHLIRKERTCSKHKLKAQAQNALSARLRRTVSRLKMHGTERSMHKERTPKTHGTQALNAQSAVLSERSMHTQCPLMAHGRHILDARSTLKTHGEQAQTARS